MTIRCQRCGFENRTGSRFCAGCGAKLRGFGRGGIMPPRPPRRSGGRWAVVAVVLAICLVIGGISVWILRPRTGDAPSVNGADTVTYDSGMGVGGDAPDGAASVTWSVTHEEDEEPFASGESEVVDGRWEADWALLRPGENVVTATSDTGATTTAAITYENSTLVDPDPEHVVVDEETGIPYVDNYLLMAFDPELSDEEVEDVIVDLGGTVMGRLFGAGLWQVGLDQLVGKTLREAQMLADELEERDEIWVATTDACISITTTESSEPSTNPNDTWKGPNGAGPEGWTEDNPRGTNWGMEAIHATTAQRFVSSHQHVVVPVGIADDTFDMDHEDISYSFVNEERRNVINDFNNRVSSSGLSGWGTKHGMHVTGIVGASVNNGRGVGGVCNSCSITVDATGPQVLAYAGRTGDAGDYAFISGVCTSVYNLIESGVRIVNLSLGICFEKDKDKLDTDEGMNLYVNLLHETEKVSSAVMVRLLEDRWDEARHAFRDDFVVVQSSGNGNNGGGTAVYAHLNGFFCGLTPDWGYYHKHVSRQDVFDRIIVVGAAEKPKRNGNGSLSYQQTDYSNGGERVDVCAPGKDILSTVSTNGYDYDSGTSMAAPHVTGVAGLVWSVNPSLSGADVKRIIRETATTVVAVNPFSYGGGVTCQSESRLVDALAAVRRAYDERPKSEQVETTVQDIEADSPNVVDGESDVEEAPSESKPEAVAEDGGLGTFNSLMTDDGEYVYFAEQSVEASAGPTLRRVSRARPDGSDYQCIYEGSDGDFINRLTMAGDWLVVSTGENILSMRTDGTDAHVTVGGSSGYVRGSRFAVSDGMLYYPAIVGPGAWEIRSCVASGADSSVLCSGGFSQGSVGPHVEGIAGGRILFTTGVQSGASTYTLWSVPIEGGEATEIGKAPFGKVAVAGGRAYLMDSETLVSMLPDGSDCREVCTISGSGMGILYNATDEVAYLGSGSSMWRVSLPDGALTSLGEQHFESGQMEIVGGQVYFHYGIEGRIRKVDASMVDQGDFR